MVHAAGTQIIIDREKRTIGIQYPQEKKPREIYSLDEDWVQPYTVCRVCGKEIKDSKLAFAFWKHEQAVCNSNCYDQEIINRYGCCKQAIKNPCVCSYSFVCSIHGETHIGTHD